jgi:uncharacterized protein YbaR (Trm112 family)
MALSDFLVGILVDPVDLKGLLYSEEENLLYNDRRHVAFAVEDDIPVLLETEARAIDAAEHQRLVGLANLRRTGPKS